MSATIQLTIDHHEVEAQPGQTILELTRGLGIDIPTLCFLEKCRPATSCLVCLVSVQARRDGPARIVPACGTPVQDGMVVTCQSPEVREARKVAFELLLSDHVGDCLSPCQRICPLQLNIPAMLRQVQSGDLEGAARTMKSALPLPGVLGRLCHHPCENGCRRATYDESAAIRDLERFVSDRDHQSTHPFVPPCLPATGKKVAVVGTGPAGLAVAHALLRLGHDCTLFDRQAKAGGSLRDEKIEADLPGEVLDREIAELESMGAQFQCETEVQDEARLTELTKRFDAVVLALGEEKAETLKEFGLEVGTTGLRIKPATFETSRAGVFAVGSVVKPIKQVVRALSEGSAAAEAVGHFLGGEKIVPRERPFSSIMGRLDPGELQLFLKGPSLEGRVCASGAGGVNFNPHEASCEAKRCLHCDCRAAGNCQLQHYAQLYGAEPNRFHGGRRRFEQEQQPGGVIFEPGKCILCGICVQLTEQAAEPLGLTFIGRGFDVRIGAPFDHAIAEGLQKVAEACVEHCPTGALVFSDS